MKLQIVASVAGLAFYLAVSVTPGFVWPGTVAVLWCLDIIVNQSKSD